MNVPVICPYCKTLTRIGNYKSHKKVACTGCKKVFLLPKLKIVSQTFSTRIRVLLYIATVLLCLFVIYCIVNKNKIAEQIGNQQSTTETNANQLDEAAKQKLDEISNKAEQINSVATSKTNQNADLNKMANAAKEDLYEISKKMDKQYSAFIVGFIDAYSDGRFALSELDDRILYSSEGVNYSTETKEAYTRWRAVEKARIGVK
jgi:hypothetical protein